MWGERNNCTFLEDLKHRLFKTRFLLTGEDQEARVSYSHRKDTAISSSGWAFWGAAFHQRVLLYQLRNLTVLLSFVQVTGPSSADTARTVPPRRGTWRPTSSVSIACLLTTASIRTAGSSALGRTRKLRGAWRMSQAVQQAQPSRPRRAAMGWSSAQPALHSPLLHGALAAPGLQSAGCVPGRRIACQLPEVYGMLPTFRCIYTYIYMCPPVHIYIFYTHAHTQSYAH